MDADLIGAMEARLLAVERRCVRLEDDTRTLSRAIGLARQRLWDSWADLRRRPIPVVPAAGHPLAGICGGITLPDSIPFTDPWFSVSSTLDWDGSSAWIKCVSGIVHPTPGTTFALHYKLTRSTSGAASVLLTASWASDGSFRPVASDCSTATSQNDITYSSFTETCPPTTYSKKFISNASLTIRSLYQSNTAQVTVGPVAPV